MSEGTDERSLQAWARLAGFLYLFTNATAIFAFYVSGAVIEKNDAVRTAANLAASETFFRMGLASEILMIVGLTALLVALYVMLKPINRNLALLAAFCRMIENSVLVVGVFSAFMAIELVKSGAYMRGADPQQLNGLMYAFVRMHSLGFQVSFLFLGVGSAMFSYLLLKSRYVPWLLATWGIVASLVMAVVALGIIVWPPLYGIVTMAYMAPMGIFEFTLGLWLLLKGIKVPATLPSQTQV